MVSSRRESKSSPLIGGFTHFAVPQNVLTLRWPNLHATGKSDTAEARD